MQPYQAPPNPYAAPAPQMYRQNFFVPQGARSGPLVGPTLRKVKLVTGIAQIVSMVAMIALFVAAGVIGPGDNDPVIWAALGCLGLFYLLIIAYAIVNVIWVYQFWSWIPPEQRHTSLWKKYISPGAAVGFMFIPYFNIFWMFVIYLGIADIMERLRVAYPSSRGPAKTLAILAIVIPMVFFPAGPFLHYMFAKHVEEMAKEMQARMMA